MVSTLNSLDGRIKANAAIVPAGANGQISVYATDTTNVIVDVNGYFAPVSGSTLAFYPLPPCRVADTRHSTYPQGLGPPSLTGGQERAFPILNATTCNIPSERGRLFAELHGRAPRTAGLPDGLAHGSEPGLRFPL